MDGSDYELPPLRREAAGPSNSRPGALPPCDPAVSDNSSDSAFFSSDDLADASIDKYTTDSRKHQYKRAWYEDEHPSRLHTYKQMRQATRRPKDSGIYMNSDSSNSSADDGFSVTSIKARSPTKSTTRKLEQFRKPAKPVRHAPPTAHNYIKNAVDECVEKGEEMLDLMDHGLSSLPHDVFIPLGSYVRRLRFDSTAYAEQSLHPLTPSLQVFLGKNRLDSVPGSLVGLPILQVLSLRHNNLTELPPCIVRATKLTELNVSCNRLRWLPWELLTLCQHGQLSGLRARPNPFMKPSRIPEALQESEQASSPGTNNSLASAKEGRYRYCGSTAFSFFEQCGSPHKASPGVPSESPSDTLDIVAQPKAVLQRQARTRVPSLFETALRTCTSTAPAQHTLSLLPTEAPQAVVDALKRGDAVTYQGGRECSVCGRQYVTAMVEWVEFWQDISSRGQDAILPFLRRTCSWACAVDAEV